MNPNLERILTKLSKEEVSLEKHEVELAGMFKSIDEIKKMYNDVKVVRDQITALKSQISQLVVKLNNDGKSLNVRVSEFQKEIGKTITEAKALGLEVPADVKNLQSFVKEYPKIAQNVFKLANQMDAGIKII